MDTQQRCPCNEPGTQKMSPTFTPDPAAVFADKETILFVDDDPVNTESFVLSFEEEYNIITTTSGEEALETFRRNQDISVVISDQRMEGMSGVELLAQVYAINPDTMRIIITGYIDVSDIIDAVNRGHIYQYVLKPWDIVQLKLILEQATKTWQLTRENQQLTQALRAKNELLLEANTRLRESEEQLRSLSGALMHAREDEQKRIALELHDELGQALASLKLQIRIIEKECASGPSGGSQCVISRLQELREFINEIINTTRRISKNLSPVIIDDLGLDAAIQHLVQHFSEVYGISCVCDLPSLGSFFERENYLFIYRLLQEALSNVGRHSGASEVHLFLEERDDTLLVTVQDDGVGFSEQELEMVSLEQRGLGMTVMAERIKMLGGTLERHSAPGEGTRITFHLPRKRADRERADG